MKHKMAILILICCAVMMCSPALAAKKSSTPAPTFPPLKNEYYPTNNKAYPSSPTNPHLHTRDITFKGAALDIYTKINMVTQIVLPSAPVLVTVGKPDAFVLEVIPEFNTLFVKPAREVEITNMIVTTESGGVYIFVLKENPFVPWDVRVQIKDPYRQRGGGDTQPVVNMLYNGRRLPEYQFNPMDMRTPNSSAFVYDPLTRMGCSIKLKRAIAMPKDNMSAYWVEYRNIVPGKLTLPTSSYSISEQTIWTPGLIKVAVPGQKDGSSRPIMYKGDVTHMFIFVRNGVIPPVFKFRFSLMGSRNVPVDVSLPTVGVQKKSTGIKGEKSVDDRLQEYYDKLVKQGKIKPMSAAEVDAASGGTKNEPVTQAPAEGSAPITMSDTTQYQAPAAPPVPADTSGLNVQ